MQAILMFVGSGGGVNACADMPRKGAARGVRPLPIGRQRYRRVSGPLIGHEGRLRIGRDSFPDFDSEGYGKRFFAEFPNCSPRGKNARKRKDRNCVNPKSRFERARMRKGRCVLTTSRCFRGRARRLAERARAISKHDDGPSQCSSRDSAAERPARHHRRLRGESRRTEPSLPVPRKSDSLTIPRGSDEAKSTHAVPNITHGAEAHA